MPAMYFKQVRTGAVKDLESCGMEWGLRLSHAHPCSVALAPENTTITHYFEFPSKSVRLLLYFLNPMRII